MAIEGTRTAFMVRSQPGGMYALEDMSRGTGNRFYVHHGGSASTSAGRNPDVPITTIDAAIGLCTANQGDLIQVMEGHAETITSAGAIACDVAGITIEGLGNGADRPEITFTSTDNTASVLVTGASTKIKNIIGICGDDGLTNPFHIQAADCDLDIEWHDASAAVEAAACVVATAAADRIKVNLKYIGFIAGSGLVSCVYLDGINQGDVNVDFYGKASTAVVEFDDTAVVDVNVTGYMYNSGTTNFTKDVVDTATGSTWSANFFDGAYGGRVSGGSGSALASDDVSVIGSQVTSTGTLVDSVGTQVSTIDSEISVINTEISVIDNELGTVASKQTSNTTLWSTQYSTIISKLNSNS